MTVSRGDDDGDDNIDSDDGDREGHSIDVILFFISLYVSVPSRYLLEVGDGESFY